MSRSHPMQLTVLFRVLLKGRYDLVLIGSDSPIDHKMFEFDETEWVVVVVVEINIEGAPPGPAQSRAVPRRETVTPAIV